MGGCDAEDTALVNLWLELTFPKSKGILLSPIGCLSVFWKSLNWAWKECPERIEDKETLQTGYVLSTILKHRRKEQIWRL